jgi:SAM-dependent methyltransferase
MTSYVKIANHYERCLSEHGDTSKGVDWPNEEDARKRHFVMLDLIRPSSSPVSLLDFGCGAGHLLETIQKSPDRPPIEYTGLDINLAFIELCRKKFPDKQFLCLDVLQEQLTSTFDYIVCNGVFTEKLDLPYDEMFEFLERVLENLWPLCRHGIAFNVMTKHVDWERDDLFHVPFDAMAQMCKRKFSRHIQFRSDYGPYEYTVFLYKNPNYSK